VLAGNGAILSNRALIQLALLAKHHGFRIVVDEVMTAGRTGPHLLRTLVAPDQFQDVVSHVTMGKWPCVGLVLHNHLAHAVLTEHDSRGATTGIDISDPMSYLKAVVVKLLIINERRANVLKKVKVSKDEAWGIGLLLFVPKFRQDSMPGMKSHLLPLLADAKIDSVKFA